MSMHTPASQPYSYLVYRSRLIFGIRSTSVRPWKCCGPVFTFGLSEYGLVAQKLEVYCSENACSAVPSVPPFSVLVHLRLTFCTSHRLPIYVSSAHDDANLVFKRARIHPSRIHIDNQALDTVIAVKSMFYIFVLRVSVVCLVSSGGCSLLSLLRLFESHRQKRKRKQKQRELNGFSCRTISFVLIQVTNFTTMLETFKRQRL